MLFEGDMNNTGGRNDVSSKSEGLRLSIQHYMKGEGDSLLSFLQRKQEGGGKFLPLYGCSKDFGIHCRA